MQIARPVSLIISILVVAGLGSSVAAETQAVEFVCPDSGMGLSAVNVLEATGDHDVFLDHLREYDPEGYEILTDPAASDKTIWAPTDAAFANLGDAAGRSSTKRVPAS